MTATFDQPLTPEFQPPRMLHVAVDAASGNTRGPFITTHAHYFYNPATNTYVMVPVGFRSDFASFPRLLWRIFEKVGPWSRAALFHDWAYRSQTMTRFDAVCLFGSILEADKVSWFIRPAFFVALRLCGAWAWRGNAELLAQTGGRIDLREDLALLAADGVFFPERS